MILHLLRYFHLSALTVSILFGACTPVGTPAPEWVSAKTSESGVCRYYYDSLESNGNPVDEKKLKEEIKKIAIAHLTEEILGEYRERATLSEPEKIKAAEYLQGFLPSEINAGNTVVFYAESEEPQKYYGRLCVDKTRVGIINSDAAKGLENLFKSRQSSPAAPPVALESVTPAAPKPGKSVVRDGMQLFPAKGKQILFSIFGKEKTVTLARDFELSVAPVTVGEFRKYFLAQVGTGKQTGHYSCSVGVKGKTVVREYSETHPFENPGFNQTDHHPAVCVSWLETMDFIAWKNRNADGYRYRLPTIAELKHALRSENTENACVFNLKDIAYADKNEDSYRIFPCDDGYPETAPVNVNSSYIGNIGMFTCSENHPGQPWDECFAEQDFVGYERYFCGPSWRSSDLDERERTQEQLLSRKLMNKALSPKNLETCSSISYRRRSSEVGFRLVREKLN